MAGCRRRRGAQRAMVGPVVHGPRTGSGNHTGVISMGAMPYEVTTPVFEGPFDLLLHLILRQQVELYDVSLSTIVDAYLVELDRIQQGPERLNRDLLLARLLECKTFKDAAVALSHLAAAAGRSYPRTAGLEERFAGLAPDLL